MIKKNVLILVLSCLFIVGAITLYIFISIRKPQPTTHTPEPASMELMDYKGQLVPAFATKWLQYFSDAPTTSMMELPMDKLEDLVVVTPPENLEGSARAFVAYLKRAPGKWKGGRLNELCLFKIRHNASDLHKAFLVWVLYDLHP